MNDPLVQAKFAECLALARAARVLFYRVVSLRARGSGPTPDSNVSRVAGSQAYRALHELAMLVLGEEALIRDSIGDMTRTMSSSVAAGAYEIQMDQIATKMLALPRS
jgi:alkylation response protein AidB-like acyl-CoA dehydrogenase